MMRLKSLRSGERRATWVAPGRTTVVSRGEETAGGVEILPTRLGELRHMGGDPARA